MSRTSMALKRLGVAAVAAVTVVGVLPALSAPAVANHTVTGITLTPDADSAPTGTCNQFTATVTFSNPGDTATVDVLAQPRAAGQDVTFCTLNTQTTQGGAAAGTVATEQGSTQVGNTNSRTREFIVDAADGSSTGSVTFGILSNEAGVIDVTAFSENTATNAGNGVPDSNETIRDTSVKTFTAGGQQAVTALDAEPESAVNIQNDTHTFTARLTQQDGQPVPNVGTVKFDITAGPDAGQAVTANNPNGVRACNEAPQNGTSDQQGTVSCSFTNNGGPGTDTIIVFLDRDNDNVLDDNEPRDEITKTFQAPQQAGTTVQLTCESVRTNAAGDQCTNPLSENTERFTALVRNAAGQPVAGAAVRFFITNQTGDTNTNATTGADEGANGTAANPDVESLSPVSCQTDANGVCSTVLTNPRTTQGETVTVTARIVTGPGSTNVEDSATKTFSNPASTEARNIVLTPETQNAGTPGVAALTATVTDRLGRAVQGVQVTFTESGPGAFRNGGSTFVAITDANGRAIAELQSVAGEAGGTNTVTATITGFQVADADPATNGNQPGIVARRTGTADDECEQAAANTGGGTGNNVPGGTAGNCSDTSTVVFGANTSPTATPTATTQPTQAPGCTTADTARTRVITNTISAGARGIVEVDAPANSVVQLFAYSRPSTTFRLVRQAETSTGLVRFDNLTPPTNTRFQARVVKNGVGCAFGGSVVMNVRTTISLIAKRIGVRTYVFSGDSLPARPGGLIVSLYRVTNDGRQILTAQTRANASNGEYSITRRFTGSGRFGFVVRTGQDLQNAPGSSNVRSLAVF